MRWFAISLTLMGILPSLVACGALDAGAETESRSAISIDLPDKPKDVAQGSVVAILWQAKNAPRGSTVSIWVRKTLTDHLLGPVLSNLPTSGHLAWRIPPYRPSRAPCARDATGGCVGGMNPGTTYAIVARLYAAPLQDSAQPFPPELLASADSESFLMRPQTSKVGTQP